MTSPAPFLSRQFGDYTLVAQLSEDSLGIVYRALYSADERRFVRLRIFHPDALSARALEAAIHEHATIATPLVHDAIVARPQLDTVEGVSFLTWDEAAGWTLDNMLARVRALGIRIPAEYALLVAERVAAALEHAFRAAPDGRPTPHGLLWPGFVSISHDGAVRVGGFGVADAVLPSLHDAKLLAEIGPYVAPEVRSVGVAGENSDVFSVGAILMELLTGRKPSLDSQGPELRAGDPRSDELESFLRKCMAPTDARFASAVDAHRALQQLVTANPFSLYTANLALFLYKLLNPESHAVAQTSDLESTNPVVVHGAATAEAAEAANAAGGPPPLPGTLRRRRGDAATDGEVFPESAPEVAAAVAAAARALESSPSEAGDADRLSLSEARLHARPPLPALARAWARPAATLAAAATVAVGAFLIASQIHSIRGAAASEKLAPASGRLAMEAAATTSHASDAVVPAMRTDPPAPPAAPTGPIAPSTAAATAPPPPSAARPAAAKPAKKIRKELRQPAEELRLRAALARIEADRLNAGETARAIFVEGRTNEKEGERLLRERDYQAAQLAFSRAARLFQRAQEVTWEERVRRSEISPAK